MLDFNTLVKIDNLEELRSFKGDRLIEIPEKYKNSISLWSLFHAALPYTVKQGFEAIYLSNDSSSIVSLDEFSSTPKNIISLVILRQDYHDFIIFENDAEFNDYISSFHFKASNTAYFKIDEVAAEELIAKTLQDKIDYYDREIEKSEEVIKSESERIKELEALKAGL